MNIETQVQLVIDALENVKGIDIQVFDTTGMTSLFDRLVIVSGQSNRQTKALANSVYDMAHENGLSILSREGDDTGEWVVIDLGDIVVHCMQPAIREYYDLEGLWGQKTA